MLEGKVFVTRTIHILFNSKSLWLPCLSRVNFQDSSFLFWEGKHSFLKLQMERKSSKEHPTLVHHYSVQIIANTLYITVGDVRNVWELLGIHSPCKNTGLNVIFFLPCFSLSLIDQFISKQPQRDLRIYRVQFESINYAPKWLQTYSLLFAWVSAVNTAGNTGTSE